MVDGLEVPGTRPKQGAVNMMHPPMQKSQANMTRLPATVAATPTARMQFRQVIGKIINYN